MKPIKYRAYMESQKVMIPWEQLKTFPNLVDVLERTHLNVMEYTGMKDGNGVEMYESDIVKYVKSYPNYPDNPHIDVMKVYWNEIELCWYVEGISEHMMLSFFDNVDLEVIGNIFDGKNHA